MNPSPSPEAVVAAYLERMQQRGVITDDQAKAVQMVVSKIAALPAAIAQATGPDA